MNSASEIRYRRSRFSTRLPTDRLYSPSHCWLAEEGPGLWRVGFTQFAIRMLGDFVEIGFEAGPADPVSVGQVIGHVEGFKAVTSLFCVIDGEFVGTNPALEQDIVLADTDPYDQGWLYRARGVPDQKSLDVHGYIATLDATIDRMMEDRMMEEHADGDDAL